MYVITSISDIWFGKAGTTAKSQHHSDLRLHTTQLLEAVYQLSCTISHSNSSTFLIIQTWFSGWNGIIISFSIMRTAISNNSDTEIMNMPSPRAPQCRRIVAVKCLDVHQASWSEKVSRPRLPRADLVWWGVCVKTECILCKMFYYK